MAKKKVNYVQHLLLVAIVVFIIVGVANFGATGYAGKESADGPDKYDVKLWTCSWDNGWKWIGQSSKQTYRVGSHLTQTQAYCDGYNWICQKADKTPLTGVSFDCNDDGMQGATCLCRR